MLIRALTRADKKAIEPTLSSGTFCFGEVAEWLKAPLSKSGIPFTRDRGFESHPLRQIRYKMKRLQGRFFAVCFLFAIRLLNPVNHSTNYFQFRTGIICFRDRLVSSASNANDQID
jgi:hypothetical protein